MQTEFTEAELLASHDVAEPLFAGLVDAVFRLRRGSSTSSAASFQL